MRVMNLLPWREALYKRRRRKFNTALVGILAVCLVCSAAHYRKQARYRLDYDKKVITLQRTLLRLQQEHELLQKTEADMLDFMRNVAVLQLKWNRQREWQQQLVQWQWLSQDTHISNVSWQGNELLLSGRSDALYSLRQLMQQSPHWQLEQIELDAQSGFRFVLSGAVQSQGNF